MTCIVALKQDNRIYMGADSLSANGNWEATIRRDPKMFRLQNMLIGFTSSYRMGQLLRYKLELQPIKEEQDVFEWMVVEFVEAARKCLSAGGYTTIKDNYEASGHFLVGVNDRIFRVEGNFQVVEPVWPYICTGYGDSFARGSLYSTQGSVLNGEKRVLLALETAAAFSAAVREPFHVKYIEADNYSSGGK